MNDLLVATPLQKGTEISVNNIPFHEIADIFPLIQGKEFVELKADIAANGVHEPIVMYEGQILDGRNRFRACQEVGVQPEFVEYEGADPVGYVISLNLYRRHLTVSQLAPIALEVEEIHSEFAKKRMTDGIKPNPEANLPQGYFPKTKDEQQKCVYRALNKSGASYGDEVVYFIQSVRGGDIKIGVSSSPDERLSQLQTASSEMLRITNIIQGGYEKEKSLHDRYAKHRLSGEWFSPVASLAELACAIPGRAKQSSEIAAEKFGISGRTVREVKRLCQENPGLREKLKSGETTIEDEKRRIKQEKDAAFKLNVERQKKELELMDAPILDRKYHVISIDPPWPYPEQYDSDGRRVANPYPPMSIDEIAELEMPAADDSVLWLWTTHKFLPDAFDLLESWDFEYKATMVWDKQKMGMGHWLRMQCEFCLLAVRGNPVWSNTTVRDIISSPRREHSRKPDEFFDFVNEICVGAKLEYFSREKREGWDQIGNDTEKF